MERRSSPPRLLWISGAGRRRPVAVPLTADVRHGDEPSPPRLMAVGKRLGLPSAQAFTLIELLVVIAILGILASLLFPALSRGKSSAYRVKCGNNLRQLGMAAQMYWDEHEGETFPHFVTRTNGGQIYWFGWIEDGGEGARRFDASQGALFSYLGGRGVEVCPAFDYSGGDLKLKATGASYGYGYNLNLAPRTGPPVRISDLKVPTHTALFADAAQVNTWQAPASPSNPKLEEWYYLDDNPRQPNVHFRHQRTANVVFCDTHVESERSEPGSMDTRLPGACVGRLKPQLLQVP